MKEKIKNNKTYLFITLVILAIVLTLGISYAYWRLTKEQTGVNVVNTDCFSIDFVGENDITLNNAFPIPDAELESFLSNSTPYHFTITNQCSSLASATINLESLNANTNKQLADEWIDAILYETDYHRKLNKSKKLTGNPNNDANKVIKDALHAYSLKSFTLKANEVKDYYLLLYMDQETPLQEDTQNATWKGKITLSAEYKVDQFANSGTLRAISVSDTKGMWNYKDKLTKIVIETKKSKKEGVEGQNVYGPFNEGISGSEDAIQSYIVCEAEDTNCIGYLQGDGGIKLNSDSSYLFKNFTNVTEINGIENLDTSNVTNMSQMFEGLRNLQSLDISSFDTSHVTTMSWMFKEMRNLTSLTFGDNFDTSSVTNMSLMFYNCSQLKELDLSNFDTKNVIYMDDMFEGVRNLQELDLSNFDTSHVTTMYQMFQEMSSLQELDLSSFDTSSVTDMGSMFREMRNLTSLTFGDNFDTSNVINMNAMFRNMSNIQTLDLTHFNTSSVKDMSFMFYNCSLLEELDLSHFDTSSVTNMSSMFDSAKNLNKIIYGPNFIHKDETDTSGMFNNCQANKPNGSVHSSWEDVTF